MNVPRGRATSRGRGLIALPFKPPFPPMEARAMDELPAGKQWQYEPKWDGFRCLAFRDGTEVVLQSKSGQPLERYFPELVEGMLALEVPRFVLDGEIVVPVGRELSFDGLLQRIHPAESRVVKLAAEHPATFVAFDLLVDERGRSLADRPLAERRPALEGFAAKRFEPRTRALLSPATTSLAKARLWYDRVGAAFDGVVAKRLDLPYASGTRNGMVKVKRLRTADCVVGGFRYATGKKLVGSLLLGLYDEDDLLHHVGFTSGIKAAEREALTKKLEPLVGPPGFTGRSPGGPSRWSTERSGDWVPLKPRLVVEVRYDHMTGGRFRHGTSLMRWRPDKAPKGCTLDQVERPPGTVLGLQPAR